MTVSEEARVLRVARVRRGVIRRGSAMGPTSPPPVEMLPVKESELGDDDVKEEGAVVAGGVSVAATSVALEVLQVMERSSLGEGRVERCSERDAEANGGGGNTPDEAIRACGATIDSTSVCIDVSGRVMDAKEQPAGEAPHERGPGVTLDVAVALALGVLLVVRVGDTLGVGGGESDAPHAVQLDSRNAPPMGLHVKPEGHGMIDVALGQKEPGGHSTGVMKRIMWLPKSVTYTTLVDDTAMPMGRLNLAAAP